MALRYSCLVSAAALSLTISIAPVMADDTSANDVVPPVTPPVVLEDNQTLAIDPNSLQELPEPIEQDVATMVVDDSDAGSDEDFMSGDIDVVIGVGGVVAPDYVGSDDYKVSPFPIVQVNYQDLVYFDGAQQSLALNVMGSGDLKVGPLVKLDLGRDQDDNNALRGLGDVDFSIEVGGYVEYSVSGITVEASLVKDIAAGHEGLVGTVGIGYSMPLAQGLYFNVGSELTWASGEYLRSYFGVSEAQAARSGYAAYQIKSGLKDVGLNASLTYSIDQNWSINGYVGFKRLLDDVADSPIVKLRGAPEQFYSGVSATYRF